jgi:hypothetical protein
VIVFGLRFLEQRAFAQDKGVFVPIAELQLRLSDGDEPKTDCGEPWPHRVANVCFATRTTPAGMERHLEFYATQVEKAGWRAIGEEGRGGATMILKFAPPTQFPGDWRLCITYAPNTRREPDGGKVYFWLWSRSDGCDSITD